MEPQKIKKLVLNKETISNLNEDRMNIIRGGASGTGTEMIGTCLTDGCSYYCAFSPDGAQTACGTCAGNGSGYIICCDYTSWMC